MSVEREEERTLEVLRLAPHVDQELLALYFENRRRSGGGPLVSVEQRGDRATLVFEEAEAAARVLSKEVHALQSADMRVRKPARKDPSRLLLRGLGPSTGMDLLKAYVENTLGLDQEDYELSFPPARDCVLVQLRQPLSQDFQTLSKISQRSVGGASLTLEEVQQTDSVLVGNLHPSTGPEALSSYFEGGGNQVVMEVTRLSETTAKVSFLHHSSVDLVLAQPHQLEGSNLELRPYFDFLQPTQADPPRAAGGDRASSSATLGDEAGPAAAAEPVLLSDFVSVADPVKLTLFQLGNFQQEIGKTHPDVRIQVKEHGVHVEAAERRMFEEVRDSLLEHVCHMAETYFTLEPQEADFLDRQEVRERLQRPLEDIPATYTVLDTNVVVSALSRAAACQACSFLRSQLGRARIPMDSQYKCIFQSGEWLRFLEVLPLASVSVSKQSIHVLTLRGLESEKQMEVTDFLISQMESEVVVHMEPDVLRFIQAHCHRLLVQMDQVSLIPLESAEVSAFKIYGHPVACSAAQETLQSLVASVCTRTVSVGSPGVARYLLEPYCSHFLGELEEELQVLIVVKQQPWEPLAEQDFFHAAWVQMATKNFRRAPVGALPLASEPSNNDLLKSAKEVFAAAAVDVVDLTRDQSPDGTGEGDGAPQPSPDLEEEAKLSLAIQYSMDSHQRSAKEEEQLQMALMLSNEDQGLDNGMEQLNEAISASLEEALKASSSVQLQLFATQQSTLLKAEDAFKKEVRQRQVVEKLDHSTAGDMTEYDRKCLEAIERKHVVEIQVEGTIIFVSGFRRFVSEALSDVRLLLSRMSHSASEQKVLKTVRWLFHHPGSSATTPYSPEVTVFLENAWRMKMVKVEVLLDQQSHVINFRDMQEVHRASGRSVSISRELLSSGATGTDQGQGSSVLKKLPSATKLDELSEEYYLVTQAFSKSMGGYRSRMRIVQVDKLANRLLYHQYQLKRISVQQSSSQADFERTLYHGTSEETITEICLHGFNRSFCGKNGTAFGQGVYFAVSSVVTLDRRYSPPNAAGHKFVLVSRVLTGDYTKGCPSLKAAPLKQDGDVPLRYDSVVNDVAKPEIFVIFNDTQAFPEYLITCELLKDVRQRK